MLSNAAHVFECSTWVEATEILELELEVETLLAFCLVAQESPLIPDNTLLLE